MTYIPRLEKKESKQIRRIVDETLVLFFITMNLNHDYPQKWEEVMSLNYKIIGVTTMGGGIWIMIIFINEKK